MAKDPKKPGSRAKLRVIKPHERPGNVADPSKYGVDMAKPATNQNFTFPTLPKKEPTMATEEDVPPVPNSGPQVPTEPQPIATQQNTVQNPKKVPLSKVLMVSVALPIALMSIVFTAQSWYITHTEFKKTELEFAQADKILEMRKIGIVINPKQDLPSQRESSSLFASIPANTLPFAGTPAENTGNQGSKDCIGVGQVSSGELCSISSKLEHNLQNSTNARWTQTSCVGSMDFTADDVSTPEKFRGSSNKHFKESDSCGNVTYIVKQGWLKFKP